MEFYSHAEVRMSAADIQRFININNLPEWCASIEEVTEEHGSRGDILTRWGPATIHREIISNGIRFSCPNHPSAMQWSITTEPGRPSEVLVHLTTNRPEHAASDLESMQHLIADWRAGLEDWPIRRAAKMKKPCVTCGDSFGGFG